MGGICEGRCKCACPGLYLHQRAAVHIGVGRAVVEAVDAHPVVRGQRLLGSKVALHPVLLLGAPVSASGRRQAGGVNKSRQDAQMQAGAGLQNDRHPVAQPPSETGPGRSHLYMARSPEGKLAWQVTLATWNPTAFFISA